MKIDKGDFDGLNGTPMLQWDMSKEQVHNVIQYIKTFAPKVWEGKGKKLGEELVVSKDPYGPSHKSFAIQKGKEVYQGSVLFTLVE